MKPITVIEALKKLETLAGSDISIEGIFSFEFENIAIWQDKEALKKADYDSSLWLGVGWGSLGFNERACEALNGKRVVVEGKLLKPDPKFGGGHMGLWPAEFLARTLEREKC